MDVQPQSLQAQREKGPVVSSEDGIGRRRVLTVAYYLGVCLLPFSAGGWLHLGLFETPGPDRADDLVSLYFVIGLSVFALLLVLASAIPLLQSSPKRLAFGTVWCLFLIACVLGCGECVLRTQAPAWPALGLHGVSADVARKAWAHGESKAEQLNEWGQRDRDRSIVKPEGTFRIAMIGDSFLEESADVPLPLSVEQKLGRPDVEVLNLGVSATDPDEYYYRVKNIALALDVDHCLFFVYAGNDFSAPARTLETTGGIVAVSPRGSLFSSLGLFGWNHYLTNRDRPVLQAWFAAGDLLAAETRLGRRIAESNDREVRDLLYSLDSAGRDLVQQQILARRLNSPEMPRFFNMLRHPDKGLFRSYYLKAALWSASVGGGQWEELSEEAAYHWVRAAKRLCEARNVGFTLIVIPEAFQVDGRMVEEWRPLTEMKTLTSTCRTTSHRLIERAQRDGVETIDLHESFDGVSGTYLNLDGHWSEKGVNLAADVISQWLKDRVLPERESP